MADLKTDYVDDVLDLTKNTNRKYLMRDKDGNILQEDISLEETTEFEVEGSKFGARDINETNTRVNELSSDLVEIKKGQIYSTEETIIGKWINNKPIYRKVITETPTTAGNITDPASWKTLTHNIPNIDNIVKTEVFAIDEGVTFYVFRSRANKTTVYYAPMYGNYGYGANTNTFYFVLEYTKTID